MGRRHRTTTAKSHTLPSSPSHSSSSSDFEFTISLSPHKSSAAAADDLFYKGQLLPLHLSPRLSMVRTLLSSSTSTSTTSSTTASRDSTASHSSSDLLLDCDSSRPSSAADDDFIKRPYTTAESDLLSRKSSRYFSLAKFSSVFRKEATRTAAPSGGAAAVKRVSSSAREVLRKYLKKVKPLYEKLSHKQQQQQQQQKTPPRPAPPPTPPRSNESWTRPISLSFSGNLSYPRKRSHISSCPSSMTSSPKHGASGFGPTTAVRAGSGPFNMGGSSMEELQSAIQGAIAHCKNSMLKNNGITLSSEKLI